MKFMWTGLLWFGLSTAILFSQESFREHVMTNFSGFSVLFMLSVLNIWLLSRVVGALLGMASTGGAPLGIQTLFFGALKFACLGALAAAIYQLRALQTGALLFGMATVVVVPLLGGYWWSRQELKVSK